MLLQKDEAQGRGMRCNTGWILRAIKGIGDKFSVKEDLP